MDPNLLIIILVVAVLGIAGLLIYNRRRSQHLQSKFGEEYQRQVEELGSQRKAEADLAAREKRVEKLSIRPLGPADRDRFARQWAEVQAKFVDDPRRAVDLADGLVGEVMSERGYPVEDFDQRAGDISVDHPHVVQNYRAGHDIAVRHRKGEAGTEDLRQAMIHYRALFEELVDERRVVEQGA